MTRGAPDGKGEFCSMLCALHFGEKSLAASMGLDKGMIKYVGFFDKKNHLFTGRVITNSKNTTVANYAIKNSMPLWKEKISSECILSTKKYDKPIP